MSTSEDGQKYWYNRTVAGYIRDNKQECSYSSMYLTDVYKRKFNQIKNKLRHNVLFKRKLLEHYDSKCICSIYE